MNKLKSFFIALAIISASTSSFAAIETTKKIAGTAVKGTAKVVGKVFDAGGKVVGTVYDVGGKIVGETTEIADKGYDKFIDKKLSITPTIGTQGLGIEAAYKINDYFAVRGGPNYMQWSDNPTLSALTYNYDLDFFNVGALIDVHPFKNAFRISTGGFYGQKSIDFTSTPSGPSQIGGSVYSASQIGTIRGTVEGEDFTPYFGFGYTRKWMEDDNFFFDADVGVTFDSITTQLRATGTAATEASFQNDLRSEGRKIDNFFDLIETYPVIRLGVGYKF
ncbi:MAG: hypothetical protein SFT90_01460 [Rickettsiales bacterium]|nr:hypothetical protein [Rickettsiales bacterium]